MELNKEMKFNKEEVVKNEIETLKYLELTLENFLENLTLSSDIIFDRYQIEKRTMVNSDLKERYDDTLCSMLNLENYLKENRILYKSRLKKLSKELSDRNL